MTAFGTPFGASGTEHSAGLVPDPGSTAGTTKFLREDSTWDVPTYVPGGGTVTSVAIDVPADESVSGSPITTAGTITISRNSQSENEFLASPDGSSGVPSYRHIVPADVPILQPAGSGHAAGLAPDPGSSAGSSKYLREDATWDVPPDTSIGTITDGTNTVSPASSLTFEDGVVGGSSPNATYTPRVFAAGSGITLTPVGNTTTIAASGAGAVVKIVDETLGSDSATWDVDVPSGYTHLTVYMYNLGNHGHTFDIRLNGTNALTASIVSSGNERGIILEMMLSFSDGTGYVVLPTLVGMYYYDQLTGLNVVYGGSIAAASAVAGPITSVGMENAGGDNAGAGSRIMVYGWT